MYKSFFGLSRNPFELSPDPSFLCPLGTSEEALAAIYYAIMRRKGFVVLTGEVGTGKTLLVRYLCDFWKDGKIPFAHITGPRLSVTDFLSYVTFDLGIKVTEPTKGNLLRALYEFLIAQFEKGLTTILIVDEAHQTTRAVLEEIRVLTNFETAQEKLLQILLVGQPELDKRLDSFELRQLKQRIAIRCQLEPLCQEETGSYIEHRLRLGGANAQASTIFPADTVGAIYRYSSGIPRLINSICEQALVAAYARQVQVVPVEVIDQVASYFRLQPGAYCEQTDSFGLQVEQKSGSNAKPSEPSVSASERAPYFNAGSKQGRHVEAKSTEKAVPSAVSAKSSEHQQIQGSTTTSTAPAVSTIETDRLGSAPELRNGNTETKSLTARQSSASGKDLREEPRDSTDAVQQSKTEEGLDADLTARNSSRDSQPQSPLAAHPQAVPQPKLHRSLISAGVIILLVLAKAGIGLFRSGVVDNSAAKRAPVIAAPVNNDSSPEVGQSMPASDPAETATGHAAKATASRASRRFSRGERIARSKRLVSGDASSVLLDSLNDAHPTYHSHIVEAPTEPALDPGAVSLDERSALRAIIPAPDLAVPAAPDPTT